MVPLAPGSATLGGRRIPVSRYALRGRELDVTVVYEQRSGVALATVRLVMSRTAG